MRVTTEFRLPNRLPIGYSRSYSVHPETISFPCILWKMKSNAFVLRCVFAVSMLSVVPLSAFAVPALVTSQRGLEKIFSYPYASELIASERGGRFAFALSAAQTVNTQPLNGAVNGCLNVKSYGATGNGTTNDAAAINAAINATATAANGGSCVILAAGTYYVGNPATPIRMAGNIILRGAGELQSKIAGANGPLIIQASGSTIRDLSITASATSAPLSRPSAPSGADSATGGSLAAGTYYAYVAALNASGFTTAASVQSAGVTTTGTTSSIAWSWAPVSGASSYNLYIGEASGATIVHQVSGITGTNYREATWTNNTGNAPPQINYTQTIGIALDQTTNGNNRGAGYGIIQNVSLTGNGAGGFGIECINCLQELITHNSISGWHEGIRTDPWLGNDTIYRSNS